MPKFLKRIFPWIKYIIIIVVLLLVAQQLHKSWGELVKYDWNKIHLDWFCYSGVFFLMGFFPATIFWWYILRQMGQKPTLFASIRAYYISQLGKYTPGKAMVVIMRSDIIRSKDVRASFAAAAVFFETFTMMAVGAFMSAVIMLIYFADHEELAKYMLLNFAMLALSCLPTVPIIFRWFAKKLGVGKGDPELDEKLKRINLKTIAVGWGLMGIGWLFIGLSLWATSKGIGIDPGAFISHYPQYVAIMGMSV
ncbi:MAG: lysylphosphatidylglycerol synthase domain-containing protein, partial [Thermoguttaceae bacterium]